MAQTAAQLPPPPPDWEPRRDTIGGVDYVLRWPGPWNETRDWPATPKVFGEALRRAIAACAITQEGLAHEPPVLNITARRTIARWVTGKGGHKLVAVKVLAVAQRFAGESAKHPDPAAVRGALVEYLQAWVLLCHTGRAAEWHISMIEDDLVAGPWDLRSYAPAVRTLLFAQQWIGWEARPNGLAATPIAGQDLSPAERQPSVRALSRMAATRPVAAVESVTATIGHIPPVETVVIVIPTTPE